jgi:hypothetical protein
METPSGSILKGDFSAARAGVRTNKDFTTSGSSCVPATTEAKRRFSGRADLQVCLEERCVAEDGEVIAVNVRADIEFVDSEVLGSASSVQQ